MIDLSWSQEASRATRSTMPIAPAGHLWWLERKKKKETWLSTLNLRACTIARLSIPPAAIRMQPRSPLRTIAVRDTHTRTKTSVRCVLQNACATGCHCPHVLRCVAWHPHETQLPTVVRSRDTLSSIIDSAIRFFPTKRYIARDGDFQRGRRYSNVERPCVSCDDVGKSRTDVFSLPYKSAARIERWTLCKVN